MTQTVDERLIGRLEELAGRHQALMDQLHDPAVASNPARSVHIAKEMGKLKRLVDPFREFRKVKARLDEAHQVEADASEDRDLRDLAAEEIPQLEEEYHDRLEGLKERMVTNEDAEVSSVILEIRAGTGGDEAALFARDLYEMYLRYCERKKFRVEVIDQSGSDLGGLKEIVLNIRGEGVYSHLGYEGGGHRVQRVPETESQGRVHTSAVTVAVLPEPEEIDIQVNWENDVEEYVSRAGGPGGQNVNKVSSAIRLLHRDTGITVSMRDEKSQHKNRAKAWRVLRSRIYEMHRRKERQQRDSQRRTMIGSGDRSQKIRTYNFPQNRVTDHRINLSLYNLDKIILGEMDGLVVALQDYDKQQRLESL